MSLLKRWSKTPRRLSNKRLNSSPDTDAPVSWSVVDSAAEALVLPQTAEEADLGGENLVVGDLVNQLFTWGQRTRIDGLIEGDQLPAQSARTELPPPSLKLL